MIKETAVYNGVTMWIKHHPDAIDKPDNYTMPAVTYDGDVWGWVYDGISYRAAKEGDFITVSFENTASDPRIDILKDYEDKVYGEWSTCPKCDNDKVQKESNYCNKCGCKIKWVTIKWHEDI